MDKKTLIIVLNNMTRDSLKNEVLRKTMSSINSLKLSDICDIIRIYNDEDLICEALLILSTKINKKDLNQDDIVKIIYKLTLDSSKLESLQVLVELFDELDSEIASEILSKMASDSNKSRAMSVIAKKIKKISGKNVLPIIEKINSDASKIECLRILEKKIKRMSDQEFIDILLNIDDHRYKINCLNTLKDKINIDIQNAISTMDSVDSDSLKVSALAIFVSTGFEATYQELLSLCNKTISFDSRKDIVLLFDNVKGEIEDYDKYCKELFEKIAVKKYYIQVAKHLKLKEEYIKKYTIETDGSISKEIELKKFTDKENLKPQEGIIYRDGVIETTIKCSK